MKKFTANGMYGEGDVWVLETLEDFDEYLKLNPDTCLSPKGWYNVFKEGFSNYKGKYIDDKKQLKYMLNGIGVYVRYKLIGVEVNDAWSDVYWILENEDDPRDTRTELELTFLDPDIKKY